MKKQNYKNLFETNFLDSDYLMVNNTTNQNLSKTELMRQ